MRKMFSEKQIGNIALSQNEDNIKNLAWESVSQDHATDLVEPIIDTVNYGIQKGLIQAGGKTYYMHYISVISNSSSTTRADFYLHIISSNSTPIQNISDLYNFLTNYLSPSPTQARKRLPIIVDYGGLQLNSQKVNFTNAYILPSANSNMFNIYYDYETNEGVITTTNFIISSSHISSIVDAVIEL